MKNTEETIRVKHKSFFSRIDVQIEPQKYFMWMKNPCSATVLYNWNHDVCEEYMN